MSKLEEQEIKDLQENQSKINNLINSLGLYYFQKMNARKALKSLILQSEDLNKEQSELKTGLEKKYGKISIDLPSGEYKPIDENISE
tara:strand:- start:300 stop:560 length:261 start_codon:yes stop_codon:yes gene_type:complete